MFKSMFTNKYETYTPEAQDICCKIRESIEPIIKENLEKGYSLRDLELIMLEEISGLVSESILIRNFNILKRGNR